MKSMIKLAFVVALLTPSLAWAEGSHMGNIRVNPLGLLFGSFNVGADFAVSDQFTLGGGGSYSSLSSGSTKASAFGIEARAQYFFDKVFTDDWYLAPFFAYSSGTGEDGINSDIDVTVTSFGAAIGYMWIWDNFNIQFGGGLQSLSIDADSNATNFTSLDGVLPYLEFTLGYAF